MGASDYDREYALLVLEWNGNANSWKQNEQQNYQKHVAINGWQLGEGLLPHKEDLSNAKSSWDGQYFGSDENSKLQLSQKQANGWGLNGLKYDGRSLR